MNEYSTGRLVGVVTDNAGDSVTYLLFANNYFIVTQTILKEAKILK